MYNGIKKEKKLWDGTKLENQAKIELYCHLLLKSGRIYEIYIFLGELIKYLHVLNICKLFETFNYVN